ncbi:Lcl domain-containing protein [Psychrobacter sp. I-STPA10]|uniref:Lcl domain-containing protein n=1 Tax=Psychrobacter sp. I-STPA10 TaxID=2585769 RepID=UPI001E3D5A75|nr:DUF1566 domain-containing protein [Psychrobacter sp. I-STPA10]
MNILKNSKQTKYVLTISALLIASTAVAATLTTLHAPDKFTPATPTDSFKLADGTATVEVSQLEWARCLVGQTFSNGTCTGDATKFETWEAALAAAGTQAAEGWRVPNIKELMFITENTQAFPAINTEVFPFAKQFEFSDDGSYQRLPTAPSSSYIWSSTPVKVKTVKHDDEGNKLPESEYAAATEKARENTDFTYALDLGLGQPQEVHRSGETIGERYTKPYGNSDPNHVKKARYVLLVKDVS